MMFLRNTSQIWKNIVANGEFNMESVARIYDATGDDTNGVAGSDSRGAYKEYATITAPIISRSLLSGDALSVGNAIAGQLKFTLMTTDTIPKSAMIVIRGRVKDETNTSEWLEFGTFWLDHRVVTDNLIDIEAYDAMKKGNQAYVDNSQALVWPKTIKVVVQRIAEQMGVAIDSRTVDDVIDADVGDLEVVSKPSDDMSLLDILSNIGGILGGNWTITDVNQLRFVAPITPSKETPFIIDERHNFIKTEQNDYLIWTGDEQEHVDQIPPTGYGICYVPVVIGNLTTANKYTVSKVTIARDSESIFSVGDDTGYELVRTDSNPYASVAMAQVLYEKMYGIEYAPFDSTNAIYDPATELGDWIVVGSVCSVLYNETRTLNVGFSADIAAPSMDEFEDEYPYQSFVQKTQYNLDAVNANIGIIQSEITQLPGSILLQVSQTYETLEDAATKVGVNEIRSKFALDPTNIVLTAGQDGHGHSTGTITMNAGTLIVNGSNFSLDANGHMSCNEASITGTLENGDRSDGRWIAIEDGEVTGGDDGRAYGFIDFAAETFDEDVQRDRYGIQMSADVLRISTNKIAVSNSSDISVHATYGFTGRVYIITDIRNNGSGGITWDRSYLDFINGICTSATITI